MTVSALRNHGAELSTGEFIAFIDSDCLIGPDYFEQALPVLRQLADATGSEYALEDALSLDPESLVHAPRSGKGRCC